MLPNFQLHPVLLFRWYIYSKERHLPLDRRVGCDISSALVLSVLIIIAPYEVRLPNSALFHSSRCEAVFG